MLQLFLETLDEIIVYTAELTEIVIVVGERMVQKI